MKPRSQLVSAPGRRSGRRSMRMRVRSGRRRRPTVAWGVSLARQAYTFPEIGASVYVLKSGFIWRFDRWFVACVVWMVSAAVLMRRLLGPCLDGLSHFLIMFPIARALCLLSVSFFLLNSAFLYPLHLVENPGRGSTVCWWNRGGSLYLSLTCLVIADFCVVQ